MDITQFNKELTSRITTAKRCEKNGEIKLAIKLWLEISEMTISLSKNPKLDASFRNMLMNRTKGIFEHVRNLKSDQLKEELYYEGSEALPEVSEIEESIDPIQSESENQYIEESDQETISSSNSGRTMKVIENSDLKNLPKGFKEIETSGDFEIITPHDKDFVKKQLDNALNSKFSKKHVQGDSEEDSLPQKRVDFEQPKDGNYKTCFACGYDKLSVKDKVCKNCGTNLE
ncbi:MAG: hypothetical protein R3255_07570 [Candidatus Lokiarchaeia archaeon]|nr:hypothetical protein [Candidatus Lokiarchaeia archaeon]